MDSTSRRYVLVCSLAALCAAALVDAAPAAGPPAPIIHAPTPPPPPPPAPIVHAPPPAPAPSPAPIAHAPPPAPPAPTRAPTPVAAPTPPAANPFNDPNNPANPNSPLNPSNQPYSGENISNPYSAYNLRHPESPYSALNPNNPINPASLDNPNNPANPNSPLNINNPANPASPNNSINIQRRQEAAQRAAQEAGQKAAQGAPGVRSRDDGPRYKDGLFGIFEGANPVVVYRRGGRELECRVGVDCPRSVYAAVGRPAPAGAADDVSPPAAPAKHRRRDGRGARD